MWLKRRREGRSGIYPPEFPTLSWSNPELRKLVYFIGATTVANIVIGSQVAYSAINYMDSVSFCGKTCHTVMEPEFTAYQASPHSRVECVKCHIGPGASWFVQSKLSGTRQLFAVTFKTYPRPIPTPVHNLRPARETCEACHWPQKYGEDRVRVINKFADDETNSLTKTVLLMKIGGGNHGVGIHGTHLGPGVTIRYAATDEQRQNIPWVEYNGPGRQTLYTTADAKPNGGGAPIRGMDCMDCHNRPAHSYDLPERGMDKAMAAGLISNNLPFVKKKGVEILKGNYLNRDEAAQKIPAAFIKYLPGQLPRDLRPTPGGHRRVRPTGAGGLEPQHLPRNESDLGRLPDEYWAHRFPRLLPLPRRRPQRQGRQEHLTRLQRLPQPVGDG